MTESKLLQRVRRLLALAEHPGTSAEEAESANRKAAELIAQYGIDQALLAQAGEVQDTITSREFTIAEPYSRDRADLLHYVASAFRCHTVNHRSGRSIVSATVVGFESDLDRVALLYPSLLIQADRQLVHARPHPFSGESVRAFRVAWWLGFRTAVWRRLTAAEAEAAEASEQNANPGTALILADRKALVKVAAKKLFPDLRKGRKRKTTASSGYVDGHQAGSRADLGGAKLGEAQQRA